MKKKGQLQISFGMIFSIILIIAFIGVAIYVITIFLGIQRCGQIGNFYAGLQESVENAYRSPETSDDLSFSMPSKVEYVCFIDVERAPRGPMASIHEELSWINRNLVIHPKTDCSGLGGFDLAKIDIKELTSTENPFCIKTSRGKINLRVEKGLYDKSVKIIR